MLDQYRMKSKRAHLSQFASPEHKRRCPNCASTTNTLVCANVFNLSRGLLNYVIWFFFFAFAYSTEVEVRDFFHVDRRCRICGTVFAQGRIRSQRLDKCAQCAYSLIGNVSGTCPECGWKLMTTHRRFARKRGTQNGSKDTA